MGKLASRVIKASSLKRYDHCEDPSSGHLEHESPGQLVEHGVRVVVGGGGDVTEALAGDGHRTVITAGSLPGELLDGVWYRGAGVEGYRGTVHMSIRCSGLEVQRYTKVHTRPFSTLE